MVTKMALGWYGGKYLMVDRLLALFPPHRAYVEPFGGGAAVLLSKPPAPLEVYNDINHHLVNLFRVLRDDAKRPRLIERLRLTPYSREEHRWACLHYSDPDIDDIERAALFVTATYQSINAITGHSWSTHGARAVDHHVHAARVWRRRIERLALIAERLRYVVLECADFERVIRQYDSEDTLFYVDPPYVPSTRINKSSYEYEMTVDDHIRLLKTLVRAKGMVVVSGHPSQLYDSYLGNWCVRDYVRPSFGSVVRPDRARSTKPYRVERVWLNVRPATREQLSLFGGEPIGKESG